MSDRTVNLEENTVVKLLESEELQDLSWLWCHLVDTDESSNEQELGLGLNEEVAVLSGLTSKTDEVGLTGSVFLQVLDGTSFKLLAGLSVNLNC